MECFDAINWQDRLDNIDFPKGLFIEGQFCAASEGKTYESINPATQECLSLVASADVTDVDLAVNSARKAFEDAEWSSASPAYRKEVLLKLAQLLRENAAELALLETLNMGKRIKDSYEVDVASSADTIQWYAEAVDKVYGELAPSGSDSTGMVERVPLGVVAAIVSWNYPLTLAVWKLAPALAAGNSVILKPSEQSPHSVLRLAELAIEAGLPAGVLNVVTGAGSIVGKALGLHNDVDCITFTGSTNVGKLLMTYSAESNMKPVWVECGGKSPNLIFSDVEDLDQAADMACYGVFGSQGQVCSANSRLFIERSIYQKFVDLIIEKSKSYIPTDPLNPLSGCGVMVDQHQADTVLKYISLGIEEGGTVILGGEAGSLPASVMPTIIGDVSNSSRIAQEEIFGPVLVVIPFDSEDEAVKMANDSCFGLAASIWTNNLSRAHRVSRKLKVGTVSVNAMDAIDLSTPFGGFKQTGFGRDLSLHAFDKYTGLKTIWISHS
nr:aldehyde dehydrogenase [uncultured Amphritea sp.]